MVYISFNNSAATINHEPKGTMFQWVGLKHVENWYVSEGTSTQTLYTHDS